MSRPPPPQARRWLVAALRAHALPALQQAGFECVPLAPAQRAGESGQRVPFGRHRRRRGDAVDLLELDMQRHGVPAFRLCAGRVAAGGLAHPVGFVPADEAWSSHLPTSYEVLASPWLRRWFSPWRWWRRELTQPDVDGYVARAVAAFMPGLEAALREDRPGRHVRRIGPRRDLDDEAAQDGASVTRW